MSFKAISTVDGTSGTDGSAVTKKKKKSADSPFQDSFYPFPGEIVLDTEQIAQVQALYLSQPFIKQCRNIILRSLLKNGIKRTRGTTEIESTYEEQLMEEEFLLPMCQAAFDTIMTIGILPIAFISDTDPYIPPDMRALFASERLPPGIRVPIVPRWGTYTIKMSVIRGHTGYRFFWNPSPMNTGIFAEQHDAEVIVYDHFGMGPTLDGKLTSPIGALWADVTFMSALKDCALNAEMMACNPLLVTEPVPNADKEGTLDDCDPSSGHFVGVYADTADGDELTERDKWHAVGLNGRLFRQSMKMFTDYQKNLAMQAHDPESLKRISEAEVNQLPLPKGRKIGHQVLPQTRNDLVDLMKLIQEIICAAMGVPRSLLINDTVVRGNLEGMNEQFHNTVLLWKSIMDYVLTDLNHRIHGSEMIVEQLVKKKNENGGSLTDLKSEPSSRSQFFKSNRVIVSLAVTPILSTADLQFAMNMKWIDDHTAGMMFLRQHDISGIEIKPSSSFLKDDDRRALLGIKLPTAAAPHSAASTTSSSSSSTSQKRKTPDTSSASSGTEKRVKT